jgi:hypothetical protein
MVIAGFNPKNYIFNPTGHGEFVIKNSYEERSKII